MYPKSSFERVPVFPMDAQQSSASEVQAQCIRQWLRVVFGYLYGVNQTSDEIIYLVLAEMLIVYRSPNMSADVKQAYIHLGKLMFQKKRMNSVQTEMDRLEAGELPIPNSGKVNDFFIMMARVAQKLQIQAKPLRLSAPDMCRSRRQGRDDARSPLPFGPA